MLFYLMQILINKLQRFFLSQKIQTKPIDLLNNLVKVLCVLYIKHLIGKTVINVGQSES